MIPKQGFGSIFTEGKKFTGKHPELATSCFYPTENKRIGCPFLVWAFLYILGSYDVIINNGDFVYGNTINIVGKNNEVTNCRDTFKNKIKVKFS